MGDTLFCALGGGSQHRHRWKLQRSGRSALSSMKIVDAVKLRDEGFFEALWPSGQSVPPAPGSYKIQGRTYHGETFEMYDTYSFPYLLSEFDLYLMGEGRHYDTYEKLGAHLKTVQEVRGVNFAVWAPSARRVSVVGDFNRLGRPRKRHARSRILGHLGAFHPGTGRGSDLQIRNHRPARRHATAESRSLRFPRRAAPQYRLRSSPIWTPINGMIRSG